MDLHDDEAAPRGGDATDAHAVGGDAHEGPVGEDDVARLAHRAHDVRRSRGVPGVERVVLRDADVRARKPRLLADDAVGIGVGNGGHGMARAEERQEVFEHLRAQRDVAPVPHLERVEARVVAGARAHALRRVEPELIEVPVRAGARVIDLNHAARPGLRPHLFEDIVREPIANDRRAPARLAGVLGKRKNVHVTPGLLAGIGGELVARHRHDEARHAELPDDRREIGDDVVLGRDGELHGLGRVAEDAIARGDRRVDAQARVLVKIGRDVPARVDDPPKRGAHGAQRPRRERQLGGLGSVLRAPGEREAVIPGGDGDLTDVRDELVLRGSRNVHGAEIGGGGSKEPFHGDLARQHHDRLDAGRVFFRA